ncbi:RcnB family protein [Rhodoferax sediminis]|uniref:RcnB family protein n=1 Tax=Rhodoferax sediminis TaxID=2509614 RepID=A0A515DC18_9BURK|nr:RcnB family protein [Rhodoferax sediminis]QDL37958.1 hypothetical protein EUB48_12235 [Rhodoferax sediminis]
MKSRAAIFALAAMSMAFAGIALAQGGDNQPPQRGDYRHAGPQHQNQNRANDWRDGPQHQNQNRANDRRDGPQMRRGDAVNLTSGANADTGAGPDHNFRRGGRLPNEYRNHQYVVDDWREHHLSAPPRGYQWVQTGGDYVLVAIATGIIAQVLLGQ